MTDQPDTRHGHIEPLDPLGTPWCRWKCKHCNQINTLENLQKSKCPNARNITEKEFFEVINGKAKSL